MEMAKNRGLTASRNKKTKTPRSKNRLKYDNALKKRKGAVREVFIFISFGGEGVYSFTICINTKGDYVRPRS